MLRAALKTTNMRHLWHGNDREKLGLKLIYYILCSKDWAGDVARMGERRGFYRVLVGKPEGTGPLGRPWRRWEDNMKLDLQEVGCEQAVD